MEVETDNRWNLSSEKKDKDIAASQFYQFTPRCICKIMWSIRGRREISIVRGGVCGKWRPSAVFTINQPSRANYWAGSRAAQPAEPHNPDIYSEGEFEKSCRRCGRAERKRFSAPCNCLHSWHGWKGKGRGEVLWQRGRTCIYSCRNPASFSMKMGVNGRMARQSTNPVAKHYMHTASLDSGIICKGCVFPNTLHIIFQWCSILHATRSLTSEVKWKSWQLWTWVHEALSIFTLLINHQGVSGKVSA